MIILDAAILILTVLLLQVIKSKYPNFLFFPKGAVLFLPPEETPIDNKQGKGSKKKKEKQQNEISVIKIKYENVKEYPFSNQMGRVVLTAAALVGFMVIRFSLTPFTQYESLVSFYVLAIISVYTLKLGIDTFLLTNYSRKNCILISLGLNLSLYLLFVALQSFEGVYDQQVRQVMIDYRKHLQIIFNRNLTFLTHRSLLALVFLINFFITIALMPGIIKFGNWYAKTLKQTHYQSDQQGNGYSARRKDREQPADMIQQEATLKQQSQSLIYKLNTYLAVSLLLIVLSHRYFLQIVEEPLLDGARTVTMAVCCYLICSTIPAAIEFNGSFAYKHVLDYFEEEETQKKVQIRKKIVLYVYYIWYHYFQFAVRLLLPLFLFLTVLSWKYLYLEPSLTTHPLDSRPLSTDIECIMSQDQLSILQNLYSCPANSTMPSYISQNFFLNGVLYSIPTTLPREAIQQNMQKYGILVPEVMQQLSQYLFWYCSVTLYLMTVGYIAFIRKTVYDL